MRDFVPSTFPPGDPEFVHTEQQTGQVACAADAQSRRTFEGFGGPPPKLRRTLVDRQAAVARDRCGDPFEEVAR